MRRIPYFASLLCLFFVSCGPSLSAPRSADGSPVRIAFLLDAGWEQIDLKNPNQVEQRTSLAGYIRDNMLAQLQNSGYAARFINSPAEYTHGTGEYILVYKVVLYDAGSAAARALGGFGSGAARMDTHGELWRDATPLMQKNQSIASGKTWQKIVSKTNTLLIQEMIPYAR